MSVRTALALAAGIGLSVLAMPGCTSAQQAEAKAVNAEVMAKLNAYCDGRQKAIEALGEAGAP